MKIEDILEIIYPNVCFICEKIQKDGICTKCLKNLKRVYENYGKINYYQETYFRKHIYLFKYEGIIRQKIIDFKFNEKPYYAVGFANLMLKNKKICRLLERYDIIVSVPIHKKRKKQRGYNQSEQLAKEIVKKIPSLKLETKVLIKNKNIVPQSSLNKKQRKNNVKDVYEIINKEKIQNKKIILLDDIYTTGSTANECSKMLKLGGASKIDILTIAKD